MTLEEQRLKRAAAAEARLRGALGGDANGEGGESEEAQRWGSHGQSGSFAGLTPLGQAIGIAREVDRMEEKVVEIEGRFSASQESAANTGVGVGGDDRGSMNESVAIKGEGAAKVKEAAAMLVELLTQLQLRLDGVPADESVRPIRKAQTVRLQMLLQRLDLILASLS
eukprot:TRINITY_DN602_c0_g1_i5.p1 TRINITY_DN602_c0_g1~~TRINITY_DN602_c0_g1_i5.p1  ORF type:complete len:168 (-),score=55.88 TRINITY_DN602_c0_g1_i5:260-763(-)